MEYLLDTNALLSIIFNNKGLNAEIEKVLNNRNNRFFVSEMSLWEIEIKHNKHPDLMPFSALQIFELLADTNLSFLPVHIFHLAKLKDVYDQKIHNDPFDLLIIATALEESMILITSDKTILKYPIISKLELW